MQKPIEVTWHGIRPPEALAAHVQDRAARLERYCDRIVGCDVTLEAPVRQHHRHSGSLYRVRIELSVPGGKLVVGRDPQKGAKHSDLYAVVDGAFREARRQLEDRMRRLDQRVKAHALPTQALVARLFPDEGYGFLETPDGREIYFNARSVLRGAFRRLRVGTRVRFVEEAGDEGPQASTVEPVRRHRARPAERAPAPPAAPPAGP